MGEGEVPSSSWDLAALQKSQKPGIESWRQPNPGIEAENRVSQQTQITGWLGVQSAARTGDPRQTRTGCCSLGAPNLIWEADLKNGTLILAMLKSIIIIAAEIYSFMPGSSKHFICIDYIDLSIPSNYLILSPSDLQRN